MSARIRFAPKARGKKWGAYDTDTGSFPVQRPELPAPVPQDLPTEQAAQKVCDDLETHYREKATP